MIKKIYFVGLVLTLFISCGFAEDKISEEKIKQIFENTDVYEYATSELKENKIVYAVSNLVDEDLNTCWATHINGGLDESILLFFTSNPDLDEKWQKGIGIINGFVINKVLYENNNRAKNIEVKLYRIIADITVNDKYPRQMRTLDLKLIEKTNVTLNDEFSNESKIFFATNLENDFKNSKTSGTLVHYALVLTVKSVYKGSKYNDLCISEVKLFTE